MEDYLKKEISQRMDDPKLDVLTDNGNHYATITKIRNQSIDCGGLYCLAGAVTNLTNLFGGISLAIITGKKKNMMYHRNNIDRIYRKLKKSSHLYYKELFDTVGSKFRMVSSVVNNTPTSQPPEKGACVTFDLSWIGSDIKVLVYQISANILNTHIDHWKTIDLSLFKLENNLKTSKNYVDIEWEYVYNHLIDLFNEQQKSLPNIANTVLFESEEMAMTSA